LEKPASKSIDFSFPAESAMLLLYAWLTWNLKKAAIKIDLTRNIEIANTVSIQYCLQVFACKSSLRLRNSIKSKLFILNPLQSHYFVLGLLKHHRDPLHTHICYPTVYTKSCFT